MLDHYSYNALVRDLESQVGVTTALKAGIRYLEEIKDKSDDSVIFLSNIISIAEARLRQIRDEKTKHNQDEKEREADEILALCKQIGITPMYDISGLPPIEPGIVRLSPDGKLLAVSDDRNGEISLFSASYMKELGKLFGAGSKILSLDFSGGEPYLSGITKNGYLVVWDLENHILKVKHRFLDTPLDDRQSIQSTWSGNGQSYGAIIDLWNQKPRLITWTNNNDEFHDIELEKHSEFGLTFHPNGELLSYVYTSSYDTFDIVLYNPNSSKTIVQQELEMNDNFGNILISSDMDNIYILMGQEFIVFDWNLNVIKRDFDHKVDPNIMSYTNVSLSFEENKIALKLSGKGNNIVKEYIFDYKGELYKILLHKKEEKSINGDLPGKSSNWSIVRDIKTSKGFLVHPIIIDEKEDHVDIGLIVLKNVNLDRYSNIDFGPYDINKYSYGFLCKEKNIISVIDNSILKKINIEDRKPDVIIPYHQQRIDYDWRTIIDKHPGFRDRLNGRPYLLKVFEIEHEQFPGLYKEYNIPIMDHITEIVHQESSDANYIVINPGRKATILNLDRHDSIIEDRYEKWFLRDYFTVGEDGIYLNSREGKELLDVKKGLISSSPFVKLYLTSNEVIVNVRGKREFKFSYMKNGPDYDVTREVPNVFSVTEDGKFFSWLDDDGHLVLFDLVKGEKVFRRFIAQPMGLFPLQVKANGAYIFVDFNHNQEVDFKESMGLGDPPCSSIDLILHERNPSLGKWRTFNNPIKGVLKVVKMPDFGLNKIWTERRGGQRFFHGDRVHIESSRISIIKPIDFFTSQIKIYQLGKERNSEIGVSRTLHWTFSPLPDPTGRYIALEWESQDKPKEPIHEKSDDSPNENNNDIKKMRSYYRILDVNNGQRCKPVLQSKHGSWASSLYNNKPFGWLPNGDGLWANHEDEEGNKKCRIWYFKGDQIETRNIEGLLHRFENDNFITRNPSIKNEELLFNLNGEYIGKNSILPYDRNHEGNIKYNGMGWSHLSRWSTFENISIYSSKPILKERIAKEKVLYPIPSEHRYDSDIGKFNFNILVHEQGLLRMIRRMNTMMNIDEDLPYHIRTDYVDGYLVTFTPLLLDEYSSNEDPFNDVVIYNEEGSKPLFKIDKIVGRSQYADHYTPYYYKDGKFFFIRREGAIFEILLADMIQRDITEKITFKNFRIDSQLIPYYFDDDFYCLYQYSKNKLLFYKWNDTDFLKKLDLKENKIHPDYKPFRIGNHLFTKFDEGRSGKNGIIVDIDLKSFNGTCRNILYEDRNEVSTLSVKDGNHIVVFSSYASCNDILLPSKSIVWTLQYLPGERVLWGDGLRAWVVDSLTYPLKEVASKN